MTDLMPARKLVFHEWSTHGTCSGLDPAQSLVVLCTGQDVPRLREVHVCLDRNLLPRACSAQVLRMGCKASAMLIPPIR